MNILRNGARKIKNIIFHLMTIFYDFALKIKAHLSLKGGSAHTGN